MSLDRLQKIIARAGLASRRSAETMIANGRVRVNGKVVTELGAKADPRRDKIEVDGQRLTAEELVYIVLHKPRGCVSTLNDPEGRQTIVDLIGNVGARVHPVGRLDFATSGVLLLTNDGDLTQALLHPKKKVPKVYVVKLDGSIDEPMLERWRAGIELDDGKTLPAEARLLRHDQGKAWIEITLYQGKNQQIRRMAATTGYMAMRLARIAFAGIDHEGLRPGQWRPLSVDEMKKLKANYGEPKRIRPQRALLVQGKKAAEKQKTDKRKKRGVKRRTAK